MAEDVVRVFEHWVAQHSSGKGKKPVLSPERDRKIRSAIRSHGVDTVLAAIDGCLLSGWHMGDNPEGKKYNDIALILRNAEKIEYFSGLKDSTVPTNDDVPHTKEDWVAALVDRAFATWNVDPSRPRRHATWEAWRAVLKDLSPAECEDALTVLAVRGLEWMPRPADVRRLVLADKLSAPSALVAWGQVQMLNRATANGTVPDVLPHDCVLAAMRKISGVQGLHTNGDRDAFCVVYEQVVAEFEDGVLKVR